MMSKTELLAVLDSVCTDKKTDIINNVGQDQRLGILISSKKDKEDLIRDLNHVLTTKEFFMILLSDVRNELVPVANLTTEKLESLINTFFNHKLYEEYDNSGYAYALKQLKAIIG
ncbi:hypothetical protein [Ligilactobacillus equi]|uniref:Uncharacterized protein n=1 Tax=Ligilactobacillus equi DPC 6820 TaxID=1392007 RepID=V7HU77_9LACO|nr:hypothetical protein [Ligilactobacillus equi]ETA73779.1 hypothetical protein LEQ_0082c [Ligilactobacillus equi DPC 6820]